MRIAKISAAALAVIAVAGCDINTGPAKPAQTTCNCTPPQPAVAPPAYGEPSYSPPPHRGRHRAHRSYGGAHGYAWRREYAELSVETYDYHSTSTVTVVGDSGGYAGGGYAYEGHGGAASGTWTDGYGRVHSGAPVHRDAAVDRARAAVWRGYDADCPDDPARRR